MIRLTVVVGYFLINLISPCFLIVKIAIFFGCPKNTKIKIYFNFNKKKTPYLKLVLDTMPAA